MLPGYRKLILDWIDRTSGLATQLMGILSVGLGLDEHYIDELFGEERMSLNKLTRYLPTPPDGAGGNAHHDTGFLTVLAPGSTPSLEVQNPAAEWVPVRLLPDSFVINLGEMLQGMTGNYDVASPHRVITTETRYSTGYFHRSSLDTPLIPLPSVPEFSEAVAASPRHVNAGFMARKEETDRGWVTCVPPTGWRSTASRFGVILCVAIQISWPATTRVWFNGY